MPPFYLQLGHLLFFLFTLAAIRAIYSEPQEEQVNQACFCELALKSYTSLRLDDMQHFALIIYTTFGIISTENACIHTADMVR